MKAMDLLKEHCSKLHNRRSPSDDASGGDKCVCAGCTTLELVEALEKELGLAGYKTEFKRFRRNALLYYGPSRVLVYWIQAVPPDRVKVKFTSNGNIHDAMASDLYETKQATASIVGQKQ